MWEGAIAMRMHVKKPRGSAFLFTIVLVIPFMLIMAGVAIDVGVLVTVRNELHRATDAAALAGAGHLAFDDTVFPVARANAVAYGASNPTRFGPVSLNANGSNSPSGDVVLGVWDTSKTPPFQPSLDGTVVNAVQCRTAQTFPTSFLRLAGLTSMSMSAQSIAVSNPPNTAPACVFPIGVTTCQFFNGPAWSSQGCGTAVTFATSSGQPPGTQAGTNTGAWVDLTGANPTPGYLNTAIAAAANGTCASNPVAGETVGANNGMIQSVVETFASYFVPQYNASSATPINDHNGNPVYTGKGWDVYLPLIKTDCPPKDINQSYVIQTFAKFRFTQVINKGDCLVNNPADTNSYPLCPPPNGPGVKDPNLRAIFGYFDCAKLESTPTTIPTPRAALATRLRLVQ
jgi:Flp pilus assembly protein TadG